MEERLVFFDETLKIEAYWFKGIMQKFPNHFHEYYVIGFIESGTRKLSCKNKEYIIKTGDMMLFNPMENHTCEQMDNNSLDYRCINITKDVMQKIVFEITGIDYIPEFSQQVVYRSEQVLLLKNLHQMIVEKSSEFEKEELFYFLIEELLKEYTKPIQNSENRIDIEIQKVNLYIHQHFTELITLDTLSELSGLNKYTLIRSFTRHYAITPYQYLETLRINHAKKLLEDGVEPIEVAGIAGFTDQSHFTKFFKQFIGVTPKQYQNIFINKVNVDIQHSP